MEKILNVMTTKILEGINALALSIVAQLSRQKSKIFIMN